MLSTLNAHEVHAAQFLRVAQSGAALSSAEDLRRWLEGEVQALLPHDAVLAACGNFLQGDVRLELASGLPGAMVNASGLPGVTTHAAGLLPLLQALHGGWVAARHSPCAVDLAAGLGQALWPGLRSALVHGTRDPVPAGERLVAVLYARPSNLGDAQTRDAQETREARALALRLLVPFIDAALRRLSFASPCSPQAAPAPIRSRPADRPGPGAVGVLSEREHQIMAWVAMGKTNPEIGCILSISEFTVKNHLKSIFSKLDVTNRAQAVAKLTRLTSHA
jgi:transcriptional regulator EpsA